MAFMSFAASTEPDPPLVTVRAAGMSDRKLTVQVTKLTLSAIRLSPSNDNAKLVEKQIADLAEPAASAVRGFFEGRTFDVPLDRPLETSFPAGDTEVKVRLDQPVLGSHNGMLMISGTACVC
ncbi:hypothetical protein HZZ00_18610 [Streptomyces sp. NEAU-sy36]|uniref:hypothetical protein n=1 Tax=unclassified Streptomyces TaxID=2593676 RepID=UPI0015D63333|nr:MULTISPECIES: hypothetical protein [unclassified Streptomyces]QLJ02827.1 hypothetical protein HZZ00_18610 [Streptomyces sp. NEAU-sy36]